MRIVITTGIFPPDVGGPASYVSAAAKSLADRGHEVTVLCLSDTLESLEHVEGFLVHGVKRHQNRVRRYIQTIVAGVRIARRSDAVFAAGLNFEAMLIGAIARKPVVYRVVADYAWERAFGRGWYCGDVQSYQSSKKGLLLRTLDLIRNLPLRTAELIVVPSEYLARLVRGWRIDGHKVRVVYNAAQPVAVVEQQDRVNRQFMLITVGRLIPIKGIDALIDLLVNESSLLLTVVGGGPEYDSLVAHAINSGVAERVEFTGPLKREEVHQRIAQCDVFVLNSSIEGLPHVVLEAMQIGVPVVATDVGGTPEVVTDGSTGILIPVGDAQALRSAVRTILDNPHIGQRLADRAKSEVEKRFSFNAMISDTERILQQIVFAQRQDRR